MLSSHPALTRLAAASLFFAAVIAFSPHSPTQAGPELPAPASYSLLPKPIGTAVPADAPIVIAFADPMDMASVASVLEITPAADVRLRWDGTGTRLSIAPTGLWQTDATYTVAISAGAKAADGSQLDRDQRYAFSTQVAPVVTDFQVRLAAVDADSDAAAQDATLTRVAEEPADGGTLAPSETAREVSAVSTVRIGFSAEMDQDDVESRFAINPAVDGDLTWVGNDLVFTPTQRLEPGARYTVSVIGARDAVGNELGGKLNFSFLVRPGAQATKTSPASDASDVDGAKLEIWFSQPMDIEGTAEAFALANAITGDTVAGAVTWNDAGTKLAFRPAGALARGTEFVASLGDGARDADGNPVKVEWSFTTTAVPVATPEPVEEATTRAAAGAPARAPAAGPAPPKPVAVPPAAPASNLAGYALNQINAARAAYGKPPLVLDGGLSARASAHAQDQLNRGYYAHSSNPGTYSAWGENQCHRYGWSAQKTMDWCHSVFMSEPYPGGGNHKDNILSNRFTRVGVGVADNGRRVVITWQFAK